MASISGVFFSGVYLFSILSVCWWVYQAYAHDGAGAYVYLARQRQSLFLNPTVASALGKHLGLMSILVCFILFLYALCNGFARYFSWIPAQYHLTLGDGTVIPLATVFSCLLGICSSLVFGKWVFIGICSYWEKRALAEQSNLYFEIIREADNIPELKRIKAKTLAAIKKLEAANAVTPSIVVSRLELCVRIIDLRISDITSRQV